MALEQASSPRRRRARPDAAHAAANGGPVAVSPLPPLASLGLSAVQAATEGLVTIDQAQRIVMINPAALAMFGCTAEQALGAPLSRFVPAALRRRHAALVRAFAASGESGRPDTLRSPVRGLRANGEEFPLAASISRVDMRDEATQGPYFTAVLRDLSLEDALRQQIELLNRRMRAVFDLAPVAIWITDGDSVVFANHACATLFGAASREALVGRTLDALLAPGSYATVRRALRRAARDDASGPTVGERIVRLDGQEREVIIALARLPDHGRTVVQMAITDVSESARAQRELERSRRELRRLSASLVNAREDERRRIARELHDELGQRLTALKMELSSLKGVRSAPPPDARVDAMVEMVDDTVASVRRIATELRPLMLDDLGLNAAIEWLADGWARRMGVTVRQHLPRRDAPLPEGTAIAVYRMVQEALTNIARHAHATEVSIALRRAGGRLTLEVRDNGVGLDTASMFREGSHGLMGIRERAYMLGGEFEVAAAGGGGTRLTVRLPLTAPAEPSAAEPRP